MEITRISSVERKLRRHAKPQEQTVSTIPDFHAGPSPSEEGSASPRRADSIAQNCRWLTGIAAGFYAMHPITLAPNDFTAFSLSLQSAFHHSLTLLLHYRSWCTI